MNQALQSTASWGEAGTAGVVIAADLALEAVGHDYGGAPVIEDFSLAIGAGEVVALVGPSGCGKTTLLRLAAGLERPRRGRIRLNGRIVSGPEGHVPPERRGIGLMFQDYALFPHLTIEENVRFGLKPLAPREQVDLARRALERVGLSGYEARYPHALSGGQQQRVALARALAPRPSVLLMDEPFSNLDGRMREEVRAGTMAILREARATAVIVTHDPLEALLVADRIALMNRGRLVQEGTGEALYTAPASLFGARFFCSLNEIAAVVRSGRVETPFGAFAAPQLAAGAAALVCVRPDDVCLSAGGEGAAGHVLVRRFAGEADLLEVGIAGLERPLTARLHRPGRAGSGFEAGQSVRVQIRPEDVLVFAASES